MKLLLKHIFRSVGKKPLQPIIIVLTLALAMATSIFAFTVASTMQDEIDAAQAAKYGNAHFMVTVGNTSASRFLFADDVTDVLEGAKAVGCYELPLILQGTDATTIGVATEFERFCDVFDLSFAQYGKVTEGSLGDVAFISQAFSQKYNLGVGDTLAVETMGYAKTYRIEGIATLPFLASYDVMVDISSVVRIFASNSLLFSAIGEDFKPCNKVYVNVHGCEDLDRFEAVELLKEDPRFEGKRFDDLVALEIRQANYPVLKVIIGFAVGLSALLSAVVVFCCFYILANERTEENQALVYAGAGPKLLWGMQYAEAALYWLLGVPLGTLLAIPVIRLIPHFVGLQYIEPTVKPSAVLKSALILLAVCALTTAFFIVVGGRMRKAGAAHTTLPIRWVLYLSLLVAALLGIMYFVPAEPRLVVFVFALGALVALVFATTPIVIRGVASAWEKKYKRSQKSSAIALRYALKNVCSLKLLHNIARLCALIVIIVLVIGIVFISVGAQVQNFNHIFEADYTVLNATERAYQKTQTCQSAQTVYRAYMTQSSWGMVVSADDLSAFAEWMTVDRQLKGNEMIVSRGTAHTHNLKVGDTLAMDLEGVKFEFEVVKIANVCANYLAINCEDVGIPYNMLLVKGEEGVSKATLLNDLSQATASELAPISEVNTLLGRFISAVQTYIDAGKILLVVFIIFSLIGMIDISYESLRARREEFELYRLAGMSRKDLRRMKIAELTVTVLFGLAIGLVAFVIAAFVVNRGLSSRGLEVLRGVWAYFGQQ
jgi:ABC-type multidrug transport system fused ATPase/permease subunit